MVWDKVSGVYDFFETVYNGKVYNGTGVIAAEELEPRDRVLECACGTGAISVYLAPKCRSLTITDMSKGMLYEAEKKCRRFTNVRVRKADLTNLRVPDGSFDKVVAGNVIHLLDDPEKAVAELVRVCKKGGKVIIPTYINKEKISAEGATKLIGLLGVDFKREFTLESYRQFFADAGYENVSYKIAEGRMPCAVAVITKD